jgi:hypothetical protein
MKLPLSLFLVLSLTCSFAKPQNVFVKPQNGVSASRGTMRVTHECMGENSQRALLVEGGVLARAD